MDCLCGRPMRLLLKEKDSSWSAFGKFDKPSILKLWCCPPGGCGRLYLEQTGWEVSGTWYIAEQNETKGLQ